MLEEEYSTVKKIWTNFSLTIVTPHPENSKIQENKNSSK